MNFNNTYKMKSTFTYILFLVLFLNHAYGQQAGKDAEEHIKTLSRQKWEWMSEKDTARLTELFHEKSMFVHMGGSWDKKREIDIIAGGGIHYKKAEVYSVVVNRIGNTVILLNDIDLLAVVGGNEVINPFMVTEVYVKEKGKWKLGSLTFSRLTRQVKMSQKGKNP